MPLAPARVTPLYGDIAGFNYLWRLVKQIYALLGGEPRKVVYVGVAKSAEARRNSHWSQRNSVGRNPVKDWLCNLAEPPEYHVFEDVEDDIAFDAEQYYTEIMRQVNSDLLNVLDGYKKREVTRRKIAKALLGRPLSLEHIKSISESLSGEKHPGHKLNEAAVIYIKQHPDTPRKELALRFNVSEMTIRNVRSRIYWRHIEPDTE